MCSSSCSNVSSSAVYSNSSFISSTSETNDLKNYILKSKIFPLEKDFGKAACSRLKDQQALISHFIPVFYVYIYIYVYIEPYIVITLPGKETLKSNHEQRQDSMEQVGSPWSHFPHEQPARKVRYKLFYIPRHGQAARWPGLVLCACTLVWENLQHSTALLSPQMSLASPSTELLPLMRWCSSHGEAQCKSFLQFSAGLREERETQPSPAPTEILPSHGEGKVSKGECRTSH